jgi:hypothetical protein
MGGGTAMWQMKWEWVHGGNLSLNGNGDMGEILSLNGNGDMGEICLLRTGELLRWRRDAAERLKRSVMEVNLL